MIYINRFFFGFYNQIRKFYLNSKVYDKKISKINSQDLIYKPSPHLFSSLITYHNKKFKIDFRLESGDIFCFNNRRILHGRTPFDPNSGNRHLQGYYLERDEILARLNYFNKLQV